MLRLGHHPLGPARRNAIQYRGFTLIEILVVVAIIALLVSILLPSMARARSQVKVLKCRANLHDLGQAFAMYSDQYRRYYPINYDPFIDGVQNLWDANLMKDPQIMVCPATKNVVLSSTIRKAKTAGDYALSSASWKPGEDPPNYRIPYIPSCHLSKHAANANDSSGYHSYEYMGACKQDAKDGNYWHRRRAISIASVPVSDLVLVYDEDDASGTLGNKGCENSVDGNGNNCPQPWDNHGVEGMNMMFMDSHAQFVRKTAGLYRDYSKTPIVSKQDDNASIDLIVTKSTAPYLYGR
jgi:prepilin-type N-terminal cleavage/methylation domain-containing protein